jgi:hypothetical protein
MSKFFYVLFLSIVTFNATSYAQGETVPEPIWKNRAEYKISEKLVLQYIKDIEKDPVGNLENQAKTDYVLRWILGCPYVAIKLKNAYFEKILTDNRYEFANFMAFGMLFGEVLYYLENPFDRDKKNAMRSSIYYTMGVYKKLKVYNDQTTCEILELFIRLEQDNTLNKFIFLDN